MFGLRQQTLFAWMLRYGFAVGATAAGWGMRLALAKWVGPGLPTFITFYPPLMVVALLAGLGPGLFATALTDLIVAYWIMEPVGQFFVVAPVDRVALVMFGGMGVFVSVVAHFYRRSRLKAAANDTEVVLRETRREKEFLASLVEHASQPFAVGYPDGRLGLLNHAFEELTGYSTAELRAIDWSTALTPPEWRGIENRKLEELHRTGQPVRYEKEYVRRDGSRVPIELLVDLVRDSTGKPEYYYSFLTDITARKQAEEALRGSEERLRQLNAELEQRVAGRTAELRAASLYARSLLEASLDPLVTISAGGKITDVNEASAQVTGVPREQLIGTDFSDYFTEPQKAREGYQRVFAEGFVRDYPLAIRHSSGRVIGVLYNATVYRNEAGAVQGVFAAARDVTERMRAEAELARYRDHLEELVDLRTTELARSNEELQQFAYVASHDLQEPLRAIAGYIGLIEQRYRDMLDEKGRLQIAGAVQGATRMATLITDLLQLSRVGTQESAFEAVDLSGALEQALNDFHREIVAAGATVTWDAMPTLPVDPGQLAQLFGNLIGNALKFRGDQPPVIHVSARRDAAWWVFGVRDNGLGIEPQYFERIFVIFQRLHTRTQYPGTGIGLAICRKIVERHHGRIWVESRPGQGSTFYFTLPDAEGRR